MPKSSLFKIRNTRTAHRVGVTATISSWFAAAFVVLTGISGCSSDTRWDVDLDCAKCDVLAHRPFEVVSNMEQLPAPEALEPIEEMFWAAYFEHVLQLGAWGSDEGKTTKMDSLTDAFYVFCRHESTRLALAAIDSIVVPELAHAEHSLGEAFARFSVHFSEATTPEVFWMYSGFNFSGYPMDELMGVGLEFYLGGDHPVIVGLPRSIYPRYAQRRMKPEHLVSDALRGWLLVHFQRDYHPGRSTTAAEILYWGKVLFIARAIAPDLSLEQILNWDEPELQWAQSHELAVWIQLRKKEILYSKRAADTQRWVRDAPFTAAGAVPQESPDRLGWYMGLRWVEDYMSQNPSASLQELLDEKEVLPFLQSYRPLKP